MPTTKNEKIRTAITPITRAAGGDRETMMTVFRQHRLSYRGLNRFLSATGGRGRPDDEDSRVVVLRLNIGVGSNHMLTGKAICLTASLIFL